MIMMLNILLVALSTALVWGQVHLGKELKTKDCPPGTTGIPTSSSKIVVESVRIQDCDAFPCNMTIGNSYMTEATFKFNYAAKKIMASVFTIAENDVPRLTAMNVDLCQHVVTGSCNDIQNGTVLVGRRLWPIMHIATPNSYTFRLVVTDDNMVPTLCAELSFILMRNTSLFISPFGSFNG